MTNHITQTLRARFFALLTLIVLALLLGVFAPVFTSPAYALCALPSNPSICPPETVDIKFVKKFDGVNQGYTADQFSFLVTGDGFSQELNSGEEFAFEVGSYSVEEIGPDGFDPDLWRVKWTCPDVYMSDDNGDDQDATFEVTASNVTDGSIFCTAENQYRPARISLTKIVENEGVGTAVPNDFTFSINGGAPQSFDASGTMVLDVAPGTYTITEPDPQGYSVEYIGCESIVLGDEEQGSCKIINTYTENIVRGCTDPDADNYNPEANEDDESCTYDNGGGNNEPTYKVYGYVWHDANENKWWDGFENEEATSTEDHLDGWEVTITNGDDVSTTTPSDETGYYEFYVPAGTWTISETLQDGWSQTFPSDTVHVVEVIDESVTVAEVNSFAALVMNLLIPTAQAQTPTTYGAFNFGNAFGGPISTGGGNTNSGGGGSSSPRCQAFDATVSGGKATFSWDTTRGRDLFITADGVEIFSTTDDDEVDEGTFATNFDNDATYELTVERGNRDDSCEAEFPNGRGGGPTPQVLGDQVSVVPLGAADAGAGGAAPITIPTASPFVAALFSLAPRRNG